ncbi:three-Cys-motif partner protein TcmP [Chryseobacterium limigenitum]|nr:three-Cys-motif partner protein TcmP [Chryseobacterium limigenitum]
MNEFGGNWTENKIEILIEYARAYLKIMNGFARKYDWDLLYFDGFAGSGQIQGDNKVNAIIGAARRMLEVEEPRGFDLYYFVEKEKEYADILNSQTVPNYPNKKIFVVNEDCNVKIESLSNFLSSKKGKKFKSLAYIDPCGMQLNWKSLQTLEKHSVDVWILVPTGMGVNRLLKNNGQISDAYSAKLEQFLGMNKEEILSYFYQESKVLTLFGEETVMTKENAINKSAELYKDKLKSLFKFVSEPYVLKNKMNSVMFHFYMASNNQTAVRIANQIIKKYNN